MEDVGIGSDWLLRAMGMLRLTCLSLSLGFSVAFSIVGEAWAQSLSNSVADRLVQLDRAICLHQWSQAVDITSELIASPDVSSEYRQQLLNFRRQLQTWQGSSLSPDAQSSCDRTLSLFLAIDEEPAELEPQPLDWNRALASLGAVRPIIQLNDQPEPGDNLIPAALIANSPELLTAAVTPIDTTDGFNVVGGRLIDQQQTYNFLARLGDRISLEVDVTRTYMRGEAQLYIFDRTGRLVAQSDSPTFDGGTVQDFVAPQTDVYFAVVGHQDTVPVLDGRGMLLDWQTGSSASFDYTLTLTGVTPHSALVP